MDRNFAKLDVVSCFKSHIVQPLHTSIVVVVQNSGRREIVKSVAILRDTVWEVPKVHNLLQCSISCPNLSFTQAKRGPFLTFSKPPNGATILENNATVHNAKLEEK
jgi:hypothetical protein